MRSTKDDRIKDLEKKIEEKSAAREEARAIHKESIQLLRDGNTEKALKLNKQARERARAANGLDEDIDKLKVLKGEVRS